MNGTERPALGVIVGNRDFFPDRLVTEARADVEQLFGELGIDAVWPSESETKLGGVETYADAKACARILAENRERVSGVLVMLPNFGDEKGVADCLRLAGLDVPVLVQAYPDDMDRLSPADRRDAFCGKVSVCNNLRQYGIPYSLTTKHTTPLLGDEFGSDLARFLATCRVVRGLRGARIGAVGARPGAFNTVRYSEKILEANSVSVTTMDLSEAFAAAENLGDADERVKARLQAISAYAATDAAPPEALQRMARLAVVLGEWKDANDLDALALQCWTSMQQNFGVNPCTVMSMLSQTGTPAACEVDVTGALSMLALQLASNTPSALADWNNNYVDDDRCVLFHCGNWPSRLLDAPAVCTAPILGSIVGEEKTHGAMAGRTPAGPLTYARLTTDDAAGRMRAYVGQGAFTDDELATFGCRAVVRVADLQGLMRYVCTEGFEHHVAMSGSACADVLAEAFGTYLGWEVYHHNATRH